jgi:hypothetical protein
MYIIDKPLFSENNLSEVFSENSRCEIKKRPVVSMIPRRAGIIPFTVHPITKKMWFCLSRDAKSKELGDFGGGVKCYETPIKGAVREFIEETLGSFNLDFDFINSNYKCVIKRKNATIFFVQIPWEIAKDTVEIFRMMYQCLHSGNSPSADAEGFFHEVCDIVWFVEDKFNELLTTGSCGKEVIWVKVKAILSHLDISRIKR